MRSLRLNSLLDMLLIDFVSFSFEISLFCCQLVMALQSRKRFCCNPIFLFENDELSSKKQIAVPSSQDFQYRLYYSIHLTSNCIEKGELISFILESLHKTNALHVRCIFLIGVENAMMQRSESRFINGHNEHRIRSLQIFFHLVKYCYSDHKTSKMCSVLQLVLSLM